MDVWAVLNFVKWLAGIGTIVACAGKVVEGLSKHKLKLLLLALLAVLVKFNIPRHLAAHFLHRQEKALDTPAKVVDALPQMILQAQQRITPTTGVPVEKGSDQEGQGQVDQTKGLILLSSILGSAGLFYLWPLVEKRYLNLAAQAETPRPLVQPRAKKVLSPAPRPSRPRRRRTIL